MPHNNVIINTTMREVGLWKKKLLEKYQVEVGDTWGIIRRAGETRASSKCCPEGKT